MRLLPYGPRAVLAEMDSLDDVMAATTAWRDASLRGVVDIVPAERTVLVVHDGSLDATELVPPTDSGSDSSPGGAVVCAPVVEVPVDYDGPDLAAVAAAAGCTPAEVVALHTGAVLRAAFCGFMPGFAYLVGVAPALHLPRRASPRSRVPAGSVAIAAGYSSIYPCDSPGGWHIIGRTETVMWDERREVPALLAPGTAVRFVAR